jgi:diguanylate cyclase (GGDEF)-like protein
MKIEDIYFSFRPIFSSSNGRIFGFEAIPRVELKTGKTIVDLYNEAYLAKSLYELDFELRKKAFKKFASIKKYLAQKREKDGQDSYKQTVSSLKLFYPLDARILKMWDYRPGNTKLFIKELDIEASDIYFNIDEKPDMLTYSDVKSVLLTYKLEGFKVALNDFGAGGSGLELLYYCEPSYITLARNFVKDLKKDAQNRLFCAEVIKLAHIKGCIVGAKEIENKEEFYTLREYGCDLLSGSYLQDSFEKIKEADYKLDWMEKLVQNDKRSLSSDEEILKGKIELLETFKASSSVGDVIAKFQADEKLTVLPIVDENNSPLGVVTEKNLRKYAFTPFGIQIIQNQKAIKIASPCPVVSSRQPIDELLDLFSAKSELDGLLVVDEFRYVGFLSAKSLLEAVNEKMIKTASDQNPLTKLAGNKTIAEQSAKALSTSKKWLVFAYFDLDNFKPFNDMFGFRQGDRAILLFADTVKEELAVGKPFIGHIGGDDFFALFEFDDEAACLSCTEAVKKALEIFSQNARSFYSKDDRQKGFVIGNDRFGTERRFGLLSASCALAYFDAEAVQTTYEELSEKLTELKKKAKESADKTAAVRL